MIIKGLLNKIIVVVLVTGFLSCSSDLPVVYDVLVIGDGTGAVAAGISSARQGVSTLLTTSQPWLGGMLTSAGVSATDGNHFMPAGLWGEFRDSLRKHYGGADSLATGWISFTLFEPKVGAQIFDRMVEKEDQLKVWRNCRWQKITRGRDVWQVDLLVAGKQVTVNAKILIDGTDLGDVAAAAGATFEVGMDSRSNTGEIMAPEKSNDIIQDLTYVAILKDFSPDSAPKITPSKNYTISKYQCSCQQLCQDHEIQTHPCSTMLSYAKLPRNKFMINWPNFGNDYYLSLIDLTEEERTKELEKAKIHTLDFVYFIQHELGYPHLGLAPDEFPTSDHLPLMPYHREGRRIDGKVRLNINQILNPLLSGHESYKSGIAVGDYPIDHHHNQNPESPEIDFPPVPSFNIPLGCLVPTNLDNLVIADKAISVSNIVNGATRLQPVILQIGQAAGIIAATAVNNDQSIHQIDIREVQQKILHQRGYLMPYFDVPPEHPYFESIQKVGATGTMKGKGEPYQWANRTWFYPDSLASAQGLREMEKIIPFSLSISDSHDYIFLSDLERIAEKMGLDIKLFEKLSLENNDSPLTRGQMALILDRVFQIFENNIIDWNGFSILGIK